MHSVIVQREDGTETITIYGLGDLRVAHSDHPNFTAIKAAATGTSPDEVELENLFDTAQAISKRFEHLTDRISVRGHQIYLDLEPVHNSLAEAIIACLQADEDFVPLVNFMSKLESNPNPRSRDALFTWLDNRNFTITPDGDIIGYKGVSFDSQYTERLDEEHKGAGASMSKGHAFVDGIEYGAEGHTYIPYPIGSVVEMPRTEVVNDAGQECSQGLHVGTFSFAQSYARNGHMLEVHINPRDVVSVPDSSNSQKIRVCRLTVVGELTEQYSQPVKYPEPELDDEPYEDEDEEPTDLEDMDFSQLSEDLGLPVEEEPIAPAVSDKHPGIAAFDTMLQRARRRRQSIVPYIENMTAKEGARWEYSGDGDSTDRLNWKVSA